MFFRRAYSPCLNCALRFPKTTLLINFLLVPAVIPLAMSLGSEFMPQLREGSLMYMPTGLPMMSVEQARDVLVKTDGTIMTFPQVQSVLGKSGKFESSTDPAPVEMFETMNEKLQIPGMPVAWTQPIRNRLDMLATGVRTKVGVKVYGADYPTIEKVSREVENALKYL